MRADEMNLNTKLQKLADSLRVIEDAPSIAIRCDRVGRWEVQLFTEDFMAAFAEFSTRECKGHDGKPFWLGECVAHGVQFTAVLPESAVHPVQEAS